MRMLTPKCFIRFKQQSGSWYAAVLTRRQEQGRLLVSVRYWRKDGVWCKLGEDATGDSSHLYAMLEQWHWHSEWCDAVVCAVPVHEVEESWHPQQGLQYLLQQTRQDEKQQALCELVVLLAAQGVNSKVLGVTGSLLIGAQNRHSDIDLVVYGREHFFAVCEQMQRLRQQNKVQSLRDEDWQTTWQRRSCTLDFPTYVWHERRKQNKFLFQGHRLDISLLETEEEQCPDEGPWEKRGNMTIHATVTDGDYRFDYPARYFVDHAEIRQVVCFTATYTGQVHTGECIVAAGQVESNRQGYQRLLVGSSRAAEGQFIRLQRKAFS